MAKAKKFPTEIFVQQEFENEIPYLVAHKTPNKIDDGEEVAIYKLVSVRTMRVKFELM